MKSKSGWWADSRRHSEAKRFGRASEAAKKPKYPKKRRFTNPFSPISAEDEDALKQMGTDAGGTYVSEEEAEAGGLPYEPGHEASQLSQSSIEELTDKELGTRIHNAEEFVEKQKKENKPAESINESKYYLEMLKTEAKSRERRVRVQSPNSGKVEYLTRK